MNVIGRYQLKISLKLFCYFRIVIISKSKFAILNAPKANKRKVIFFEIYDILGSVHKGQVLDFGSHLNLGSNLDLCSK